MTTLCNTITIRETIYMQQEMFQVISMDFPSYDESFQYMLPDGDGGFYPMEVGCLLSHKEVDFIHSDFYNQYEVKGVPHTIVCLPAPPIIFTRARRKQ